MFLFLKVHFGCPATRCKQLTLMFALQANELSTETTNYEEQEQELMMVCVEELCKCSGSVSVNASCVSRIRLDLICVFLASANKQVVDLSEELARKVEDTLRQQEEISSLLAQIVDLQARCKGVREAKTQTHYTLAKSSFKLKS